MAEKNTTIRGVINNVIHDLLPKTSVYNVMVDSTTTLAAKLAEVITSLNSKVTPAQLEEAIENLPPATTETIGGVKVGDGLTVDGDGVLGVAGEKYELIESIVSDEAIGIDRTQEPDGTPYNFKAVHLRVKKPAEILHSTPVDWLAYSEGFTHYLYNNPSTEDEELWCYAEVVEWYGLWKRGRSTTWNKYGAIVTPTHMQYQSFDQKVNGYVTRIRTSTPIVAGVTYEIWGIRA